MVAEKELTFETAQERINAILNELETGNVALDKTLALFEESMELTQFCKEKLHAAEEKIKTLIKTNVGFTEKPGA